MWECEAQAGDMELSQGLHGRAMLEGVEIRNLCEDLGKKKNSELAGRTAALEDEVGDQRAAVEENKGQIKDLKAGEEGVMAKMESLENNQRRNNLRFLRVSEGLERDDLEGLVVQLIIREVHFEDLEVAIAKDIQKVQGVPAKMPPNRVKPRKI
ncbi:hypothetical protein NDU88_004025 [Pleurodeles waltl]|uniref:Uncharacterized protein n=1 Tax=Pleurodeles waltl TaxID=8319 RepID=A0AAV7M6P7_PLEWA|nr:hypothetical protein NDU88_004025 [Pleurodeles waltl]